MGSDSGKLQGGGGLLYKQCAELRIRRKVNSGSTVGLAYAGMAVQLTVATALTKNR